MTSNVGDADSLKALDLNPPNREEPDFDPITEVAQRIDVLAETLECSGVTFRAKRDPAQDMDSSA